MSKKQIHWRNFGANIPTKWDSWKYRRQSAFVIPHPKMWWQEKESFGHTKENVLSVMEHKMKVVIFILPICKSYVVENTSLPKSV